MSEPAFLALLLDGPLQSWGFSSRFQRRATAMHPTKSGVVGMICAAMGLAKGSPQEGGALPKLADLKMTTITIPRIVGGIPGPHVVYRLEEFHTTGGGYDKKTQRQFIPRKAKGGPCDDPTISRRQYLLDARFGVILEGDRELLERVAAALNDPQWGVWLGRKSCIPAQLIFRGMFDTEEESKRAIIGDKPLDLFTVTRDVGCFEDGTDSLNDKPISFGDSHSSGPEKRRFAPRRIHLQAGGSKSE